MAKNNNHKAKAVETPDETPESLDKVRDILFGGQMRTVETRLRNMEERLHRDQQSLRADVARQFGDLDGVLRKEVATLTEKLTAERTKRAEELKALAAEFREALKGLEKRHGKLEEATALADAELRDQILKQGAALTAEIGRLAERFAGELEKSVAELKAEKVDLGALVAAFNETATRLAAVGNGSGSGRASKGAARS